MGFDDRNRDRSRSPVNLRNVGCKKVFVSNIPYEFRWKALKDLFKTEVGDVSFAVVYTDKKDKSRGCGTVEFHKVDTTQKAIDKMHRFKINGRKLVVKKDNIDRDKSGCPLFGPSSGCGGGHGGVGRSGEDIRGASGLPVSDDFKLDNAYGLSPQFLESLNIRGPLVNQIFVANLDFRVDRRKLKEVFKLAGRILEVKIFLDNEGKSKGCGLVEYYHTIEAVQAISMFNNQFLYDRQMSVRFYRTDKDPLAKLPEGLQSIGMGFGVGGTPLHSVERNLASSNTSLNQSQPLTKPVNTSDLAVLNGLTSDRVGIDAQYLHSLVGVNGLGNFSAGDLGIGINLEATYKSSMNNNGVGSLLHQNSLIDRNFDSLSASASLQSSFSGVGDFAAEFRSRLVGDDMHMSMGQKKSNTIMVKNLPLYTTWKSLKNYFYDCGDIVFSKIESNGIGIIRFSSEWDAEKAITLKHLSRFYGHLIEVVYFNLQV